MTTEAVLIQAVSMRGKDFTHVKLKVQNNSESQICIAMWYAGWKPEKRSRMSVECVEGRLPVHAEPGESFEFVVDADPVDELDQLGISNGRGQFWFVDPGEILQVIEHSKLDASLWPKPDKTALEQKLKSCSVEVEACVVDNNDVKDLEIRFSNESDMPLQLTGARIEWKYAESLPQGEDLAGKPKVSLAGGGQGLRPNFDIGTVVQPQQTVVFSPDKRLAPALLQINEHVNDSDIEVQIFTDTKVYWVEKEGDIPSTIREYVGYLAERISIPTPYNALTSNLPMVVWSIPCFDRNREQPLPVYNRTHVLDWKKLDAVQLREVLAILESKKRDDEVPTDLDKVVMQMARTPSVPDNRMLKYRDYFDEVESPSLQSLFESSGASQLTFVNLRREYFEDATGKEISHYEMIAHVSGVDNPVLLGDSGSILRLGTSEPILNSGWTESDANTLAQFVDVVTRILVSDWFSSENSYTLEMCKERDNTTFSSAEETEMLEAIYPDSSNTMEVLAYFRQLHAGDKLVKKACDIYCKTCSDARRIAWIRERQSSFAASVDSTPVPFDISLTRRQVIQAFMYGAGLLHSESKHGDDVKLKELIERHGKEQTIFIFNSCLHDLLAIAVDIFQVVRVDFADWVQHRGIEGPTRYQIDDLFKDSRRNRD